MDEPIIEDWYCYDAQPSSFMRLPEHAVVVVAGTIGTDKVSIVVSGRTGDTITGTDGRSFRLGKMREDYAEFASHKTEGK